MSHPKIVQKTATAPEKPQKTAVATEEKSIVGGGDSAFAVSGKKTASTSKAATATLPSPTDTTVPVLAEQAFNTMDVQNQLKDNPMVLTEPLDFIQQLRAQFVSSSRAQLKDYTAKLPKVPPYSQLAPSVNKIKDIDEKKAMMREILIEYRRKLNTLRTMESALNKELGHVANTTTVQEQAVQVRYAQILKKTINFCVQQYQHTMNLYNNLS